MSWRRHELRLADAAADARDLEEIRDRLVLARGRLAAARERERGLERALEDERRRKVPADHDLLGPE